MGNEITRPEFIASLKLLASTGLVLDTANPDPALIRAVVRLADHVANLKVIVVHLPELAPPCEGDLEVLGHARRCTSRFRAG